MINLLQKCASCGISLEDDLNILCELCEEHHDSLEPDLRAECSSSDYADDYESEEDYE
jgi:hypothetical protein